MFENFPYTNFHDLNTDWLIAYAKDLLNKYDHLNETVAEGEAQLTAKYEELNNLLNQWYTTHSAEIAQKLADTLSEIAIFSTQKKDEIIASIPEDYSALSNTVTGIESNLSSSGLGVVPALTWQRATIYEDGHLVESTIRITSNKVNLDDTNVIWYKFYTNSGYDFDIHYYDANNVHLGIFPTGWQNTTPVTAPPYPTGSSYFRVVLRKSDDSEIDTRVSAYFHFSYTSALSGIAKDANYNPFLIPDMRDGTVSNIYNVNGIATTNIIPVRGNNCFEFYCTRERATGHFYQVRYTLYDIEEGFTGPSTATNRTLFDQIVNFDGNYCKIIFPSNTKGFSFHLQEMDEARENYFPLRIGQNIQQGDVYGYLSNKGYSIADSSNLTRYVNLDISTKRISNLQAFTIWNGKVYSVVQGTITEQDLNTMDVLRTASIEIGHGNNLQLATNGRAYTSGWDDNKLYLVSLQTLSVTQTFTLPVTGYTTCVVDDDNAVCYILQRNTDPNTEDMYALYRWDMTSDHASLVKNIGMFSALQAMDFFEGKIIFNHGLGTEASPNMMRIINTAGDTLLKTRLTFLPGEIEGVYIDRDNFNSITVSDTDRKLYKMY